MNSYVELEKKIEELNNRIVKLENIEKRRKTMLIIKIIVYIIAISIIVFLCIKTYSYINNNVIKPLKSVTSVINKNEGYMEDAKDFFNSLFNE